MVLTAQPLNQTFKDELKQIFEDIDFSIIKDVLYLDGWNTHEEWGGIFIFTGIDDTIQYCEYGYCVMAPDCDNVFLPYEVSIEQASLLAEEMDKAKEENEGWWVNNS